PYILWALANGVDVYVDKPLTAMEMDRGGPGDGRALYRDYLDLLYRSQLSRSRLMLSAPRRRHEGYRWLMTRLQDLVAEYGVPLTHVSIRHNEGSWYLPDEFLERENHPYRYGYGKLLHAGYNLIDLFMRLIMINRRLADRAPERVAIATAHT